MRAARAIAFVSVAASLWVAGAPALAERCVQIEREQVGGGADHNNFRPVVNAVQRPVVLWRVPGVRGQTTIADGHLFAGGERLVRIDPSTGMVVASHQLEGKAPVHVFEAPALTPAAVIARASDGRVFAMDHDLRDVKWTWQGSALHDIRWGGVLVGERAYVLVAGESVVALDPACGRVLWTTALAEGETASTTPASDGARVFLGTESGRFLALCVATGAPVWTHTTRSKFIVTMPTVVDGKVIVGDRGIARERPGAVNAFDASSGALLWSTDFGATGLSTPGVAVNDRGEKSIVAGFGTSVAFFDLMSGKRAAEPEIRTGRNAFGSPTVIGDTVCFGNLDGRFYVHDLATGRLRWALQLPASTDPERPNQVYDFTYAHDRFYVSSSLGLFALGQDPKSVEAPAGYVLEWAEPEAPPR